MSPRSTREKAVFSLDPKTRREHAYRFVGELVDVVVDFHRDGTTSTHRGRVLTVAIPNLGRIADQLVTEPVDDAGIPLPRHYAQTFSLATVRRIETVRR